MPEHDPDLLKRLKGRCQNPFEGTVYRVVWADRSPTEGSSVARGRWSSPDNTFEVLNSSLTSEGAAAEFEAFWSLFELHGMPWAHGPFRTIRRQKPDRVRTQPGQ